jgi:hypothetical protein
MKLFYALPLLTLQFLSPDGSSNGRSVAIASGFAPTAPTFAKRHALLSRGGSNYSALSSTSIEPDIGPSLDLVTQANWELLSERGKAALSRLILYDVANGHAQKHVYADWPEKGVDDEEKRSLGEQVSCVDRMSSLRMNILI